MKKSILAIFVVLGSLSLVHCGNSNGGDQTASTPLTCAYNDPQYGCLQSTSVCDTSNASCARLSNAILSRDVVCAHDLCARPGDVQTALGCYPVNGCGPCSALVNGQCLAGAIRYNGMGGILRFYHGRPAIVYDHRFDPKPSHHEGHHDDDDHRDDRHGPHHSKR